MNDRIHANASHDDLLGSLYDTVLSERGFQDFIETLCSVFQLKSAALITRHAGTQEVKTLWLHGVDCKWVESYVLDYAGEDLLSQYMMEAPVALFYATNLDIPNPERIANTRFYREWAAPQDIAYAAGGVILREGEWLTQMILQRARHHQPFSREELNRLNSLVSHMQRAIRMRQRHAGLQLSNRFLTGGPDILAIPTLLFDESGRVVHANHSAKAMLEKRHSLWCESGHLFTSDAAATRRFNLELAHAIRSSRSNVSAPNGVVLLSRAGRMPLMLTIVPLLLSGGGAALSFVFDPENTPRLTPGLVQQLFGLTETEAELAVALCSGKTLDDVAEEHGKSIHTVRTQLKSIFCKTETKRQADLVSLLLASPAYFLAHRGAASGLPSVAASPSDLACC